MASFKIEANHRKGIGIGATNLDKRRIVFPRQAAARRDQITNPGGLSRAIPDAAEVTLSGETSGTTASPPGMQKRGQEETLDRAEKIH